MLLLSSDLGHPRDPGLRSPARRLVGSKQIGESLSLGRIEREASEMEQDAIAGSLVGLNGLDELVGHIHHAGLFVFDAGFANVHGRSGKGGSTLGQDGEIPRKKHGKRMAEC